MDFNKFTLFGAIKGRMNWLARRQELLSQNIANADTPGYKPHDLKPFSFKDMVQRQQLPPLNMEVTNSEHLGGERKAVSPFREVVDTKPYETAPDGNAVVLEEQMAKVNETAIQHRLTTELYRKNLGLIRIAIGKGR